MPNNVIPFKLFLFEGKDGNYIREKHWHRSIEIFALCGLSPSEFRRDMRHKAMKKPSNEEKLTV